MGKVSLSQR